MKFFQKLKQEPIVFLSTKMWKYAKGYRKETILFLSMSVIAGIIWLLPPVVFGMVLNQIQINGLTSENLYTVLFLLSLIFFLEIFAWIFHGPSRILEVTTAFRIDRAYKKYLYNAVLSLPLAWHSDHESGDTIDKINKSTDGLFSYSRNSFNVVRVVVRAVGTTFILWYFNPYLAIVADLLLIFSLFVVFRFDLKLIPQYRILNIFDNKASAKVYDSISNVTTIKVLGIEDPILDSVNRSWNSSYSLFKKNKILVEWKWFTGGLFFTAIVIMPLGGYILYTYTSGLTLLVGSVSTIYIMLSNLNEVYYTFASMYEEMMIQKTRIQNVEEIEKVYEKKSIQKRKSVSNWQNLNITNLTFEYDSNSQRVLDNFAFDLKKGEKVAVIGESGSGKSTVLKLIHGMYEEATANISIDGKDYKNTSFAKLDFKSTLVPQEPEVFSASIKENLTLLTEFSDKEIKKATEMAAFSDVIENLPNKIDSIINEKGVNLSGGQKQRLALSRALLFSKDKELILLDESTSSVDSSNENKIYKNIFESFKDATVLASIHKMNLLKYFDRILIMDKGKIIDSGSFDELLERNQDFKKSWEEYIENDPD